MNSSGLEPHPCTVCTSDNVRWPVSCFARDLTWWACQLLHADDESKHQRVLRELHKCYINKINFLPFIHHRV